MPQDDMAKLIHSNLDVLSKFFNHISDMVFLMAVEPGPRFRYIMMNPSAMRASALTSDVYGQSIEDVVDEPHAQNLIARYSEAVHSRASVTYSDTIQGMSCESILTPIFDAAGTCTHVFAVTRDVTESKRLQQELQYMAYHDTLTGLPNRRLFQERLEQAIDEAGKAGRTLALLFIDCDLFKSINDEYGHDVGDEFLRVFSMRLQRSVREADTIARIGGDEFVILVPIHSVVEAEQIGQRILDAIGQPFKLMDLQFHTSASVGVGVYPIHGQTADALVRAADQALYQAKTMGRNASVLYKTK